MRSETFHTLAADFGFDPAKAVPVSGGFTGAEKFIVAANDDPAFLKATDLDVFPDEAVALDNEAASYEAIAMIPEVQKYFPRLRARRRSTSTAALLLDYLSEVTWGGPWNDTTIGLLDNALTEIGSAELAPEIARGIASRAEALQSVLRRQSLYTFDHTKRLQLLAESTDLVSGSFSNSRGQTFATIDPASARSLVESASTYDPNAGNRLVLWDMTYGNIGFSPDQVYFVDPVYLDIGDPASDRARAGINILRIVQEDDADPGLVDQVDRTFLNERSAVAFEIAYFIACTNLDYKGQETYMDFQQACAVAGLRAWERLF